MAIQAQLFSENLGFPVGNSQDLLLEFDNNNNNIAHHNHLCFAPQIHSQNQNQNQNQQQFSLEFHHNHHQFAANFERQRLEFEQFINLQNERLRMAMQEQRKQQASILIQKYELRGEFLLRRKEAEIAAAAGRNAELRALVKRVELENLTWQRAAREREAAAASLNASIQRLRDSAAAAALLSENDDAESCCRNGGGDGDDKRGRMVCRCCNTRESCVVMLPCRHLCSCKDCEVFLEACPVCSVAKKAAIEALI